MLSGLDVFVLRLILRFQTKKYENEADFTRSRLCVLWKWKECISATRNEANPLCIHLTKPFACTLRLCKKNAFLPESSAFGYPDEYFDEYYFILRIFLLQLSREIIFRIFLF